MFEDESKNYTEIMSFEEIEEAWKQSQMVYDGKFKEDGTHRRFPQEMAKKTVINRACKKLLNSSDDSSLLSSEIKNRDNRQRKEILDAEEEANANKELLEFEEVPHKEATDVTDFEEVEEIKEEPAQQTTEDEEPF